MTSASRVRKNGWDARMERIRTGQRFTQRAGGEGTIPRRYEQNAAEICGFAALVASGTFGWGLATVIGRLDPAAQIAARYDLVALGPIVEDLANPLIAFLAFFIAVSMLRVVGVFSKLAGIAIMAWVFALQAEMGVPSLVDLASYGRAVIVGELPATAAFALMLEALPDAAA